MLQANCCHPHRTTPVQRTCQEGSSKPTASTWASVKMTQQTRDKHASHISIFVADVPLNMHVVFFSAHRRQVLAWDTLTCSKRIRLKSFFLQCDSFHNCSAHVFRLICSVAVDVYLQEVSPWGTLYSASSEERGERCCIQSQNGMSFTAYRKNTDMRSRNNAHI